MDCLLKKRCKVLIIIAMIIITIIIIIMSALSHDRKRLIA